MDIPVNSTVAPEDRKRLSNQCARLLARLRQGPVTNVEIVSQLRIINGTGRISDARKAGYSIVGTNLGDGLWSYALVAEPE